MKRYIYDKRGIYTGRSIEVTKYDSFPVRSTTVAPLSSPAKWDGSNWIYLDSIPPEPPKLRNEIPLKVFKLGLFDAGLIDTVTAHIQGLSANVRKRIMIELDNGGDITLEQAKKLLSGVIDETDIENIFAA